MKIAYWTTACLAPQIEAVSKEVFDLAHAFSGSRIFAISPHLGFMASRRGRYAGLHSRFAGLLRLAMPLLEAAADVNHVYAEISPWLFLRSLGRRPILLTIASEKGELMPELIRRCAWIAVQTEGMKRRIESAGFEPANVRLIYPGIDLSRFTPRDSMPRGGRPRVLLATFPRTEKELRDRGVLLLLDTAAAHPEIDFTFLCRPWGAGDTGKDAVAGMLGARGLRNVTLVEGVQARMEDVYKRHDFTVIPYTVAEGGKECPRSLVETLACGVPVLISNAAPFSSFVAAESCGCIFEPSAAGLASAVEQGLRDYASLSVNAVRAAQAHFDVRSTMREYARIYERLHSRGGAG